jgi:hypothetical protein
MGNKLQVGDVLNTANVAINLPVEVRRGNLDCIQAINAMKAGHIVRRFNGNVSAKFHRMQNGVVQTADTARKVVEGEWKRASTDIASWVDSTFCVVTTKVESVTLTYESNLMPDNTDA